MSNTFYNRRNLDFLLFEVLNLEDLTTLPYYEEHDRETLDMTLNAAHQLAEGLLHPYFTELDRKEPKYIDGKITAHPILKDFMKAFGDGGWFSGSFPRELGGEQLPITIWYAASFIFAAANTSANSLRGLTTSAAHLIYTFGSQKLQGDFIPQMLKGKWQGTMALTEPQAGSSLADITTSAVPTENGYYRIKGQKVFISGGDYDGVENIVHLVLAKIEGGPPGTKGISLFVVPKMRNGDNGGLKNNDVTTMGTYHKMGMKGWPVAHLSFGDNNDCRGFLLGEKHQGLKYMFKMINTSRIGVGLTAAAISSAAYCASLDYARNRPQGRKIENRNMSGPQVPIIEHADVKRMLLFQKSVVEGSLALVFQCSLFADQKKHLPAVRKKDEGEKARLLLELLTPIVKTFPAEMGDESVAAGIQVLGGSGYVTDYSLEQLYRDQKINSIYEGTTAIQAMDLLGRKLPMEKGKAFRLFLHELKTISKQALQYPRLKRNGKILKQSANSLRNITLRLARVAKKEGIENFLSDATLYLRAFGLVAVAWQWLKQGIIAQKAIEGGAAGEDLDFYKSKLFAMDYYFEYEVPRLKGLLTRLKSKKRLTVKMEDKYFI